MRIRGIGTAKRIAGWARSRIHGGPLILGYHRIAETSWDPQKLCVSPENFAAQLEVLTGLAEPVRLGRVESALAAGENLQRSFVITIDDGYEDTLSAATPILKRYGVPATAFITTGVLGRPFWWCEIQQMVEDSSILPGSIEFETGGHRFQWSKMSDSRKDRARLVKAIGDFFRSLPFRQHDDALASFGRAFGTNRTEGRIKAMASDQVASLAESKLVDIGSHAVTHTSLQYLGVDEQRRELCDSKAELEEICGRPVTSCSYPNGRISKETPSIAKELGYTSACTSQEELVASGCDPYLLPRVWVGDWSAEQFRKWLRWWLR